MKKSGSLLTATLLLASAAIAAPFRSHAQSPAVAQPAQPPVALPPALPSAPTAAPADPFPPVNQKYFTAKSPTADTVNTFLKALWGYDDNRLYRVMAIQTTAAPGVAKVVVFVTDKTPNAKVGSLAFYITPDGKHAIAEGAGVVPFGANPFADIRTLLDAHADGAFRGASGKSLEIVEFADLQCPHCKEAQPTIDQIVKDFPAAHVIFQLFPLVDVHPSAYAAAAYGVCVQKQSNDAFFKYASGVFDTQDALSPASQDTILKAAVKRANLDGDAIAACASTPATKAIVDADIKLAEDAGVDQTPLLSINGRLIPLGQLPYEQLKQIIVYQAQMDGVPTGASAETLAPKPAGPTLSNLPSN